MTDLTTFRAETRAWLEANCPPAMRTRMPEEEQVAGGKRAVYVRPEQKLWLDRMAREGLDRADLAEANTAAAACPATRR